MKIAADTHVHLYSCYDVKAALAGLIGNLGNIDTEAVRAAFLTEREECHFFDDFRNGVLKMDGSGLTVEKAGEDEGIVFLENGEPALYMFAGKQFVSAERIEVLGLACDVLVDKGVPACDIVKKILDAGGVPVLSWAPGKWFLGRGQLVRSVIDMYDSGQLLLGDTIMRPTVWPEPLLMRYAKRKGLAVVAGSDPLPFAGDEKYAGTYCSLLEGAFDKNKPVTSVREILLAKNASFKNRGRRCGLLQAFLRMKKNACPP